MKISNCVLFSHNMVRCHVMAHLCPRSAKTVITCSMVHIVYFLALFLANSLFLCGFFKVPNRIDNIDWLIVILGKTAKKLIGSQGDIQYYISTIQQCRTCSHLIYAQTLAEVYQAVRFSLLLFHASIPTVTPVNWRVMVVYCKAVWLLVNTNFSWLAT